MGEGKKQGERTEVGMTKLARHSWDMTPELYCGNRVQGFQNSAARLRRALEKVPLRGTGPLDFVEL